MKGKAHIGLTLLPFGENGGTSCKEAPAEGSLQGNGWMPCSASGATPQECLTTALAAPIKRHLSPTLPEGLIMQITLRSIPECSAKALERVAKEQGYELENFVKHLIYKELEQVETSYAVKKTANAV